MWSPAALGRTWGNRDKMWQTLQVTDIQHNYVSFCAGEKERCVNPESNTMGHDCMWESVRHDRCVNKLLQQVAGNESSLSDFLTQISQICFNLRLKRSHGFTHELAYIHLCQNLLISRLISMNYATAVLISPLLFCHLGQIQISYLCDTWVGGMSPKIADLRITLVYLWVCMWLDVVRQALVHVCVCVSWQASVSPALQPDWF